MASVTTIARNLGGQRGGANWRCPCPLGCGYVVSLAEGKDGRLLAHCFGGCDYREIETALVEYGLLDDDDLIEVSRSVRSVVKRQRLCDSTDKARRIDYAQQLYESATFDPQIDVYLRSRGIAIRSSVLRFTPRYRHRLGINLPAMLAPVVNIDDEQIGVHATFFKSDGSGQAFAKPSRGELDLRRQCNGVIRGGVIRLTPYEPGRDLILAEGIETTLSAMELSGLPGWSTVSAGGLLTAELPPEIPRIVIVADRDAVGTGQRNAVTAGRRWEAEGRAVRIMMPKHIGDANDVLIARQR
jgi:hypothetical protein